jgi:acetoin utilization deacetylase AcuC-like enzyme
VPNHQFPLYFHEIYSSGLDPSARFPVDRYQLLADKLGAMDDAGLISWQTPRLASREEVLLVHQKEYVDRSVISCLKRKSGGSGYDPGKTP